MSQCEGRHCRPAPPACRSAQCGRWDTCTSGDLRDRLPTLRGPSDGVPTSRGPRGHLPTSRGPTWALTTTGFRRAAVPTSRAAEGRGDLGTDDTGLPQGGRGRGDLGTGDTGPAQGGAADLERAADAGTAAPLAAQVCSHAAESAEAGSVELARAKLHTRRLAAASVRTARCCDRGELGTASPCG